jgi:hypothetical protein
VKGGERERERERERHRVYWGFPEMPIRGLKRSLHCSHSNLSSRLHASCHLAKVSMEGLLNPQKHQRERERERERCKGEKKRRKEAPDLKPGALLLSLSTKC